MEDAQKTQLFETMPIPRAVMKLAIPTVLSSLVMVLYNLADTYFVGMLNNAVENAAVTLAAPLLLAFNAVNNLFGVGSSSMMSRALGKKDYDTVYRSSAFGFYCSVLAGLLFSVAYTVFQTPLLTLLGANQETMAATVGYARWTVTFGAVPSILNVVLAYLVRAEGSSMHASIGTMSGCFLNILLDPVFILPWGLNMGVQRIGKAVSSGTDPDEESPAHYGGFDQAGSCGRKAAVKCCRIRAKKTGSYGNRNPALPVCGKHGGRMGRSLWDRSNPETDSCMAA